MPDSPNNGHDRELYDMMMTGTARDSAALLLVESLIHGLVKRSILSVQEAVDIIEIAADVERELDPTGIDPPLGNFQSLLAPIAHSLRGDLNV